MTAGALALGAGTLAAWLIDPWCRPRARRPGDTPHLTPSPVTVVLTRRSLALGGASVCLATVVVLRLPILAVAALATAIGWHHRHRLRTRAASASRERSMPELVDALVALLHAGLTPGLAWRSLPECCPDELRSEVEAVVDRMDRGESFADALAWFGSRAGPTASAMADTLVTAERYGLPLGPVLTRLAGDAAARRRRDAESDARRIPVRLSVPLVVCTLPAFVVLTVVPVLVTALSSLPRP